MPDSGEIYVSCNALVNFYLLNELNRRKMYDSMKHTKKISH